jgi:hypothetical protein
MTEKATHRPTNPSTSIDGPTIAAGDPPSSGQRTRPGAALIHFAPARHLDPLRSVQGTHARYDCSDLAAVDGHLRHLGRRLAAVRTRSPDLACRYRDDIDTLLDRRAWLTLSITDQPERPRVNRTSLTVG